LAAAAGAVDVTGDERENNQFQLDHCLQLGSSSMLCRGACPAVLQEYNYHLGAVNTVTFIDDARRFVSSSDDKSLRVWEFGIPVQIK
jgi:WD40 repeat protein